MIFETAFLIVASFILGAVPFAVVLGRMFLHEDITRYGDGNPGAGNVFRAGSPSLGFLAVLLDLGKGVPMLLIGRLYFDMGPLILVSIGTAAILGHAFTPFLKFRGGKAVAVTFGTLIGMLEPAMLFPFTLSVVIGILLLKNHSWVVMMGPIGALSFLFLTHGAGWQILYISFIAVLFIQKHYEALIKPPGIKTGIVSALSSWGKRFR